MFLKVSIEIISLKKQINIIRRRVMRALTKDIGVNGFVANTNSLQRLPITRILISRPNHRLGNLLLITPLLKEVSKTFPDAKIDLFVKGGIAPVLFQNYENIHRIIQLPRKPFKELLAYVKVWTEIKACKYDLVINVDGTSSSGRLCTQLATAHYKIYGPQDTAIGGATADRQHIAKAPVLLFRDFCTEFGYEARQGNIPSLDLNLTERELESGRKTVNDLVKNEQKTICLFTYATGDKCYSEQWWSGFYNRLKQAAPNYNIIEVLPVENISKIGFRAPTFYSKDVREIGSVIAATAGFIGADSGIMHLASASQAPTMGLFCVTNMLKYEPYNENSLGLDTNSCEIEELLDTLLKKLCVAPSMEAFPQPAESFLIVN